MESYDKEMDIPVYVSYYFSEKSITRLKDNHLVYDFTHHTIPKGLKIKLTLSSFKLPSFNNTSKDGSPNSQMKNYFLCIEGFLISNGSRMLEHTFMIPPAGIMMESNGLQSAVGTVGHCFHLKLVDEDGKHYTGKDWAIHVIGQRC